MGNEPAVVGDSTPPPPPPPGTGLADTFATINGGVATQDSTHFFNISNVDVWLYRGDPAHPESATLVATQHAGPRGGYEGAFMFDSVPPGLYFVRADKPDDPSLAPGQSPRLDLRPGLNIDAGVFLADVPRGGPYVRIWPRRLWRESEAFTIAACGSVNVHMVAGDERGEPIPDAASKVVWRSSNTAVAAVGEVAADAWGVSRMIHTARAGDAVITAVNGRVGDSVVVHVLPNPLITCGVPVPRSRVDIVPDSVEIVVGDTVSLSASVRDSTGTLVTNPTITWVASDSSVVAMRVDGARVVVRGQRTGRGSVRASSAGTEAEAQVVVH